MKKNILKLAFCLLLFGSCSSLHYSQVNVDMTKVDIGMSEKEVRDVIGKPGNIISSYQDNKGTWKVYEYLRLEVNSYISTYVNRPYWLYFLNGKLEKWVPGEDWQGDQALLKSRLDRLKQSQTHDAKEKDGDKKE